MRNSAWLTEAAARSLNPNIGCRMYTSQALHMPEHCAQRSQFCNDVSRVASDAESLVCAIPGYVAKGHGGNTCGAEVTRNVVPKAFLHMKD
jgi:hypothetical protein